MYRKLYEEDEFERRVERGYRILEECSLCPRQCRVNRLKGEKGFCQAGKFPLVSNFGPHFGEEAPLVGHRGSGTIFLTHCHLACQFCQNYHISQLGQGEEISGD